MEYFLYWVSQLSKTQAIVLISAIVLFVVLLPYASVIVKAVKILIRRKKLEVFYFNYFVSKEQIAYSSEAEGFKLPEPDFIMEGSPVILYWQVEGALQISIFPGLGKVKGNTAQVVVSRANRTFTIEAKGLSDIITLQVEIPQHKIKSLHTSEISNFEVNSQAGKITSFPITKSSLQTQSLTGNLPHSEFHEKIPVHLSRQISYQRPPQLQKLNEEIRQMISKQSVVKSYTFTTKHYEKDNKFIPINNLTIPNNKHQRP
jgi:hypothetical protein